MQSVKIAKYERGMKMFSLILGILGSSMLSIFMRLSEKRVTNNIAMLAMNYLSCTILGGIYALGNPVENLSSQLPATLGMGMINGVFYLSSLMIFQTGVRRSGVVLSAIFMKLGLLVAMLVAICFYGELPTAVQAVGFVLALVAILLINYRKDDRKGTFGWSMILLLVLSGMASAMSKIFEQSGMTGMGDWFLFFTFATALPLALIVMVRRGERIGKWEILFGAAVGIPNFFSSKLLLMALQTIPAVVAYPVYDVSVILVVTLAGVVLFRERLTKQQLIGLGLILGALALLNL